MADKVLVGFTNAIWTDSSCGRLPTPQCVGLI